MNRTFVTALACAVSLTAFTAANATPPGFDGGSPPGGSSHGGSPHGGSPHSGSPHGASSHGGMGMGTGMGHAATHGEGAPKARDVQHWWPGQVDLSELRKNRYNPNPHGADFDYAAEFAKLDLAQVKADVAKVLTSSQDWWPADYGSYAGLFIRLAWHSAGTYRSGDGRGGSDGGQLRFEPLNSWPDNGNLDKARRLLWPVKQKYGKSLSWADLMVLAGNVSLERSGFTTYGFSGGRADAWEPELVYWGAERKFLDRDVRYKDGELEEPLGASQLALIYVNPEGPQGNPEILKSAEQIRTTFGRMGMNDEETVALIVGGHTLGKAHGARKADDCVGPEPAAEGVEEQGLGWKNTCGTGAGADATTSGLEGAWTATPVNWSNNYVENLYAFEWKLSESPNGAKQWVPENEEEVRFVPDAHIEGKFHAPIMFTTDLALRYDPEYGKVTKKWLENPGQMDDAFARAWFKLTHRDMGPNTRYVGADAPSEALIWQDPVPSAEYAMVTMADVEALKASILASDLTNSELVRAAWASASTFRDTDYRGGANGARVRLAPQNGWEANSPDELSRVLGVLDSVQADFNASANGGRKVSLADLIVIGGNAAIERAASQAGHSIGVPFTPGRTDASADMTDAASMNLLKPAADGFRNYYSERARLSPADMLIDKADTLTLSVAEMTALVGGLRALDANIGGAKHGVFTATPGALTNDFFVNLLDMANEWKPVEGQDGVFQGNDRKTGEAKWTATEVDLVFGSNSELRAVAETYAFDGAEKTFANDFVKAWTKVMELDRFDVK